jgi:hypothetical protein
VKPDRLLDPWGKKYKLEAVEGGFRVSTTTPGGETVSGRP